MKKHAREKNIQIEIEISEEQLQAITGGCQQCQADHQFIQENTAQADHYDNKATVLSALGLPNQAATQSAAAGELRRQADRVKTRLLIRDGNHLLGRI